MLILVTLLAMVAVGTFYRMGGSGNYNRVWRLVGVPAVVTAFLFYTWGFHLWALLVAFGLLAAALSTYWDWVPFNKGVDNFWMHGFFCGLAALPIAYVTGHWWLFWARCIVLAVWSGVWSLAWKWDVAEEGGRLLPLVLTLFMVV